ncbi:hypothetical protein ABEB36_000949 [Hypothenemus hampei]|uniref:Cathepsin L n=1 Tax=Hypothenemus hampei TaxID=57062 RepID=A0ABD1FCY0_HYPHA
MMIFLVFLFFFATVTSSSFVYNEEWINFKNVHNISYRNAEHELNRLKIFEENLQKIQQHNILYERGLKSYKLGITPFADLTSQEFRGILNLKHRNSQRKGRQLFQVSHNRKLPSSIDWRQMGAVTPVKDQGYCGSCWAFAVTGSLEAQYYLKYGHLISLSEQQLVDCATEEYGSQGCYGGELDSAYEYIKFSKFCFLYKLIIPTCFIIRANGIELEQSYPYTMTDDRCKKNNSLIVTKITDFVDVEPNNENALSAAVGLIGPVSVAFDAAEFDMQFYKEGVYESNSCSQTELNHAVLIVGYGSNDNGTDYWIVKNSWGPYFGMEGYMFMKRGVNQCGIALEPSYPIL